MLKHTICISILLAAVALSACSQGSTATIPPGFTGAAQPSHRAKNDITSTSVTIENTYSSQIELLGESALCLTGTPPSGVPAGSSGSPFTVSFDPSCVSNSGYFDMTYGPDGVAANACKFNINYAGGNFSYSVTNNADTNCSYILGVTPGTVTFVYAHT
jgi:hypothetical protein